MSDCAALKIIIKRIISNDKVGFKWFTTHGCGRLRHKADHYAVNLTKKGCDLILLFHDLDRNNLVELERELDGKLSKMPISTYFICIPIEEIEAWFLSDPENIKNVLNLKRIPKIKAKPETIKDPKGELYDLTSSCSDKEKKYLNTKHNALLSATISIDLIREKCNSFAKFYDFLKKQNW
jgi:Domain of unknown function (DUF4276)